MDGRVYGYTGTPATPHAQHATQAQAQAHRPEPSLGGHHPSPITIPCPSVTSVRKDLGRAGAGAGAGQERANRQARVAEERVPPATQTST